MMLETAEMNWTTLLWWMLIFMVTGQILGTLEGEDGISSCKPGYYCPRGSLVPVPCPSGTFGPLAGAWSSESCMSCPPHHYGPRPGLTSCRPCGPRAHQDQPGQNHCVCPGEGQWFQPSDGRCVCALGYTPREDEDVCVPSVYEICRGSQTRGQHGDCLSSEEWRQHCSQQVCPSPEDSEGFDETLGLCVCSPAFGGGEACGPWCEGWAPRPAAWLVCTGDLRLLYGDTSLRVGHPDTRHPAAPPLGQVTWDSL
ncbi:multiple epidermal growth factor-like domains protein 6 [Brienomyrus brachyistius]|uniref:multiple epidermal growth factor-like domains protein 6 n=1 Tax=Brienomyrus brachyistius TaxID=42636 RepID=UPI0020B44AB6|nr:multiple epidermal growth factor-like domains protein 6 [Brienomyrus brachyistius]